MSANNKTEEAKWDWIPCNYNLKREISGKTVFWNLSPSIILTNPSGSGPEPNVKLFIDTEKSLQYSCELGWNWHKSWNLPNISVRLEIKDSTTGELLLSPKNLYSHLFAVKAVLDNKDNFHLVDIGLRGVNKIELLDGHAFFSAIKFASTSYNNEGVKFHLVLTLYIMNDDDPVPKILNSTISPPIFVDSRKSARDSQVLLEKKMTSFVEPFLPENLDKIFIKRENKRKNDIEIQIYNDLDGLFNYLTAPNIRHKVKHPLFLTMKFSKCVKLFYNKETITDNSIDLIVENLQKRLCEDHRVKKGPAIIPNSNPETKTYLILFEETGDSFKTKKIIEAVEPIQSPSFGLIYSRSLIPQNFIELEDTNEMISVYRKNFANLYSTTKINRASKADSNDSDEESQEKSSEESDFSEEESKSEVITKKKKTLQTNESCPNLAGMDLIKDPYSLLKEQTEEKNKKTPERQSEKQDKKLEEQITDPNDTKLSQTNNSNENIMNQKTPLQIDQNKGINSNLLSKSIPTIDPFTPIKPNTDPLISQNLPLNPNLLNQFSQAQSNSNSNFLGNLGAGGMFGQNPLLNNPNMILDYLRNSQNNPNPQQNLNNINPHLLSLMMNNQNLMSMKLAANQTNLYGNLLNQQQNIDSLKNPAANRQNLNTQQPINPGNNNNIANLLSSMLMNNVPTQPNPYENFEKEKAMADSNLQSRINSFLMGANLNQQQSSQTFNNNNTNNQYFLKNLLLQSMQQGKNPGQDKNQDRIKKEEDKNH